MRSACVFSFLVVAVVSVHGVDGADSDGERAARMVFIPGGEFEMGDHHDGKPSALPVHLVRVDSFHMDVRETTNWQYAAALNWASAHGLIRIVGGTVYDRSGRWAYCNTRAASPTSGISRRRGQFVPVAGRGRHPVVEVTWFGAAVCANWRSAMRGLQPCYNLDTWECDFTANGYRLPTEAEWEYAARGGKHDPYLRFPWGDELDGSQANYWDSGDPYEAGDYPWTTPGGYYDGSQVPPGADMANGYGVYDMAGNVWEWCNDWYSPTYYSESPYHNPRGPAVGEARVLRGGSWGREGGSRPHTLRCANRLWHREDSRPYNFGFRMVRSAFCFAEERSQRRECPVELMVSSACRTPRCWRKRSVTCRMLAAAPRTMIISAHKSCDRWTCVTARISSW